MDTLHTKPDLIGHIDDFYLPDEILCRIFAYLDVNGLGVSCQTCHHWNNLVWSHLRCLTLNKRNNVNDQVLEWIKQSCSNLTELNISRCANVRDSSAQILLSMGHLQQLHLDYCFWISDYAFDILSSHENLSVLSLAANCRVTEAAISSMQRLPLTSLNLNSCQKLDSLAIEAISQMPLLQHLNLDNCSPMLLAGNHLQPLTKLSNTLTHLSCLRSSLVDQSLSYIGQLTKLNHLNISFNPLITDDGFEMLADLHELEFLHLTHCAQITNPSMSIIGSNMPKIKDMDITFTGVANDGLENLYKLTELRLFRASSCSVFLLSFKLLGLSSTELHSLELRDCKFIDDMDPISDDLSSELERVSLDRPAHPKPHIHIPKSSFSVFERFRTISFLSLRGSHGLDDSCLVYISKMRQLQSLDLSLIGSITCQGLASLANLPVLSSLCLEWCSQIDDSIGTVLKSFVSLRNLSLRFCKALSDKCIPGLMEVEQLKTLDLSFCNQIASRFVLTRSKTPWVLIV